MSVGKGERLTAGGLSPKDGRRGGAKSVPDTLPDPDGKPADMSEPVQVFIMMGQCNMVGMGATGPESKSGSLEFYCKTEKKYSYLLDEADNPSLGWDLLPPGSEQFEEAGMIYGDYKDPQGKWPKGTEPKEVGWYAGKHPEFKGNVATVYSNPLSNGGSGNGLYGGNAGTYMNVGEAMGRAIAELLGANDGIVP